MLNLVYYFPQYVIKKQKYIAVEVKEALIKGYTYLKEFPEN